MQETKRNCLKLYQNQKQLLVLTHEARGGGREDQPHVQGVVAARAQEDLEERSHIEGQEGRQ